MEPKKYLSEDGFKLTISKLKARQFFGNMGLSEENFTAALKTKYDNLVAGSASSADLEALTTRVASLESLIEVDETAAIDKFKEIVNFLAGIENTDTLDGLLGDISAQVTVAKETADAAKAKAEANETALGGKMGVNDVTLSAGTITIKGETITPLTEHQSLAAYATTAAMNSALSTKADTSSLADYATTAAMNTALSKKADTSSLAAYAKTADMNTALGNKVDVVDGMGLSSNDYTIAEKNAVATIANKVNESDLVAISTEEITNLLKA